MRSVNPRPGRGVQPPVRVAEGSPLRLLLAAFVASVTLAPATSACGGGGTAPSTNDPPIASFEHTPQSPFAGEVVTFESAASDPDGRVVSHAWDFGDGASGTGQTVSHTFASPGAYTVSLTVTDDGGETSGAADVMDVVPVPPLDQVAGPWYGELVSNEFPGALLSAEVHASLQPNRSIATVKYWYGGPAVVCEARWRLVGAQEGSIEVEELIVKPPEGCPEGNILLEHDPQAQTLGYTRASGGFSGSLSRADSVSFAPIAGAWTGMGVDAFDEFWIMASFDSRAVQGEAIGTVEYGTDDPADHCKGDWIAVEAEGNVFRLAERILSGPCPHGTVRLEYDPATGTMSYDFADLGDGSLNATGALTRG